MKQTSPGKLRLISALYILLFIFGFRCSAMLLLQVLHTIPIPFIGLMKYVLLCVLFIILGNNALRAFGLAPAAISKLSHSTKNFKWLFSIALLIATLARTGFFNMGTNAVSRIRYEHIAILFALALFCFWSTAILKKEELKEETARELADTEQRK